MNLKPPIQKQEIRIIVWSQQQLSRESSLISMGLGVMGGQDGALDKMSIQ